MALIPATSLWKRGLPKRNKTTSRGLDCPFRISSGRASNTHAFPHKRKDRNPMKNFLHFLAGLVIAFLLVWANISFNNHYATMLFNPIVSIFSTFLISLILFTKTITLANKKTTRWAFLTLGALIGFAGPYVFVFVMLAA
jgi:hypothetical protein